MTENDHIIELQNTASQLSRMVNKVFVTGAGGFLGNAICRALRQANIDVVGFARGSYPALIEIGVEYIQGDLQNYQSVCEAMQGCDLVFHVASKAGVWGNKESYFKPNVEGTENILSACKLLGINRLVYTSTPSVTFSGKDEAGINESQPYAEQFLNFYGLSKAIAEKKVLSCNSERLKTVALRPHLIWGPNDPHLVPRVIERAKAGKLKLVGYKDKLVDTIYIDNAVYAHLLAAIELTTESPRCAGKPYFLSNDQPITMAEMLNNILAAANLPEVKTRVPSNIAYFVGIMLEWWYLRNKKESEPIMTRFVAKQLSTSHYYNINAAKNELNYRPLVSIEHGMSLLKNSLI